MKFMKQGSVKASTWGRIVVALSLAGASTLAMAQATGGWNTMFTNLITLGRTGATAVTALSFLVGLVAIAYGGKLMWDKAGDRGDDIKMGRIIFTIVGGTILVALGFVASTTVETLGGSTSDIGAPISTQ